MLLFLICDLLYLSVLLFVPSNLYLSQFNLSKSVFEEPLKRSKKKKEWTFTVWMGFPQKLPECVGSA